MTAKERREMAHLRHKVQVLEEKLSQHIGAYGSILHEVVRYKVALQDIHAALVDCVFIANEAFDGEK